MSIHYKKFTRWAISIIIAVLGLMPSLALKASAIGNGLGVSPMIQKMVINPGETHQGSFRISNPSSATSNLYYELSVEPFYGDEQGSIVYQAEGNLSDIVDWIKFDVPTTGKLEPNDVKEVIFSVNVPKTAPAGGQYFSIMVTETNNSELEENTNKAENERQTMIKETYRMAHLVYAEVTGNVVKQGEITDVNLPSFLLSGNITGSASVKNTGNVHGDAIYKMQVFPLFSNEEIYTNEENPESITILPNRMAYHETSWKETPSIGIFNVVYTVEFEGVTTQISKMVIICPIWLLFIIIFAIIIIIFYFIIKAKNRKKTTKNSQPKQ